MVDVAKCSKCGKEFTPKDPRFKDCPECWYGSGFQQNPRPSFSGSQSTSFPTQRTDSVDLTVIRNGFLDVNGKINGKYVYDVDSKQLAELLSITEAGTGFSKKNSVGQARKFYGKLKALELRLQNSNDFSAVSGELYSLKRDAADALSRDLISKNFKILLVDKCVDHAVLSKEEFLGYCNFFESVIAYYKKEK